MDEFEAIRRAVEKAYRACHKPGRQDEAITASAECVQEFAQRAAQPRKALECPDFEGFIQKKGDLAASGSAGVFEKITELEERRARGGRGGAVVRDLGNGIACGIPD